MFYANPHNGDRYIGSGSGDGTAAQVNPGGTNGVGTIATPVTKGSDGPSDN
ncbi:hypothetical protein J2Y03_000383 [Neobacillus niacini]|uniref:hypothetical protein n=1 Tax=Neobacillus niacini TaxID=86668 RepID=UPI00286700C0|nr:hypothetical protein [Neobacillus niacini]MDR7075395.1 hypothetical protein [Neobacillus niacini]